VTKVRSHPVRPKCRRAAPSPGPDRPEFLLRTAGSGRDRTSAPLRSCAPASSTSNSTVVPRSAASCRRPHTVSAARIEPDGASAPVIPPGNDPDRQGTRLILRRSATDLAGDPTAFHIPRAAPDLVTDAGEILPVHGPRPSRLAQVLRLVPADSRRIWPISSPVSRAIRKPRSSRPVWKPPPRDSRHNSMTGITIVTPCSEVLREPRKTVQEPKSRTPDKGQRPERLAFVERPQHECLQVLSQPVESLARIGFSASQRQGLLLHSVTVPFSSSSANSSHRRTARSSRGLRNRSACSLSRSSLTKPTC